MKEVRQSAVIYSTGNGSSRRGVSVVKDSEQGGRRHQTKSLGACLHILSISPFVAVRVILKTSDLSIVQSSQRDHRHRFQVFDKGINKF